MARAQKCEDLVLGAALSATGIYASNGTNTKNGYDFAVKKVNDAGGIKIGGKCYNLSIKYYDDESTPARAAQLVERLINQDNIRFVLGPYSSPMTKAVSAGHREVPNPGGSGGGGVALAFYPGLQVPLRHRRHV
jgi:branched-chain amino acid transport system substrate-binding protein